ncbi:hypothetical protein K2173_028382 [Erythroxylum novogranatense]|uniref:Glutaminyl-peptide cyclotransferase n=1 Tax=Erythroxylum novogranatense TaxID=1862640 RepID=A0AAV8U5F9_9ROSI|nr:hypothetical protein K2173_028382 [Erythroxylum novogranatense]
MATTSSAKKKAIRRSKSQPNAPMASPFNYNKLYFIVLLIFVTGAISIFGVSSARWRRFPSANTSFPQIYTIKVLNEFYHDPKAFTQGLLYAGNDRLYESTGLYGESSVRKVDLQTGQVEILQRMGSSFFGEGLTLLGNRLFQVTWLTKTGFIYDGKNLTKIGKFTHQMDDGWGLATDGKILYGSDGTSTLYRLDPKTFKVIGKKIVKYNDREVRNLNELEFINGEVWANVWQTDCIARISYKDGRVHGWILLEKLRKELIAAGYIHIDVLNGIAWDSKDNRVFVTGKLWPRLYEIELLPLKNHYRRNEIERLCII